MNILSHPWRAIGLCAAFVAYKYSLQVFPGAIASLLMSELNLDGLTLGYLSGSFLYAVVVTQLFVGYWLDRYPVVCLIGFAIGLCGIGAIIFSFSRTFYIMMFARVLMGMGGAFAAAGYFKMTSLIVSQQYFGFVNGLLSTAMTLGILLGQIAFPSLAHLLSWREILRGLGLVGVILGLFFLRFATLANTTQGSDSLPQASLKANINWHDIIVILKNPQNWLLTLYNGLVYAPVGVFTGLWGLSFLQQGHQINSGVVYLLSACVFIGFGIGSPLLGLLVDHKYAHKKIMRYNGYLALSAIIPLIRMSEIPIWLLGVGLFIMGFSAGTVMLGFVIGKSLNNKRTEATLMTLLNTGGVAITAITEPLIGCLLDSRWSGAWLTEGVRAFSLSNYQYSLMILPIYLAVGLILLYYIREPRV
jgi:MFS family permease